MASVSFPRGGKNLTADEISGLVGDITESQKIENDIYELVFSMDRQRLYCFLTFTIKDPEKISITAEDISLELKKAGITLDPLAGNIAYAVNLMNRADTRGLSYLVVMGRPPVRGKDGWYEWHNDFPNLGKVKDEKAGRRSSPRDDHKDYREIVNVINVLKGDKLLTLHPPLVGTDGIDVDGHEMPAEPGKPVVARCGKNVEVNAEGTEFFAAIDGGLHMDQTVISVNPVFDVADDLDMAIGNIDFVGRVACHRNVQDWFTIRAKKGIEISGICEATNLESDDDIFINGGMNGKEKAVVKCGKNLYAKYLNEVESVEALGDVTVNTSIVTSHIACKGNVIVQRDGIVGGSVIALNTIDTPVLGSELGVRTKVVVGQDFLIIREMEQIQKRIDTIEAELERINNTIQPLIQNKEVLSRLPEGKKHIVKKLLGMIKELYAQKSPHDQRMIELDELSQKTAIEAKVIVRKKIFPGVTIQIKNCPLVFEEEALGPVTVMLDPKNMQLNLVRS